jgi:hypothetical protein
MALLLVAVFAFLFDGVFIGATRTAEMRNGMAVALAAFLGAVALLMPAFGNHASGWRCSRSWPRAGACYLRTERWAGLVAAPVLAKAAHVEGAQTRQPSEVPDQADLPCCQFTATSPVRGAGCPKLARAAQAASCELKALSGCDGSAKITSDALGARAAISLGARQNRRDDSGAAAEGLRLAEVRGL